MIKPEAATAVVELLMMGVRMSETYWVVHERQIINLGNCCIWLVDLLEVSDQVLHPYKTRGKIILSYILICIFLCSRQENKGSELNGSKYSPVLLLHLISSLLKFWFLSIQPSNQVTDRPTHSMKQSPSWAANISSATQEIPCIL
jgi:hypothetical protein